MSNPTRQAPEVRALRWEQLTNQAMNKQAIKPNIRDVSEYIRSYQFRLKDYELDLIKETIGQYIKTDHPSGTYIEDIANRTMVYRIYKLYRRIFDVRLQYRDEYTITFNPSEIEVIQASLMRVTYENTVAAILYGKIHQKTI